MSMSISESHLAQEAIAALSTASCPPVRPPRGPPPVRLPAVPHGGGGQREAKEALLGSEDVAVPGALLSRLCAIPFTADVPGAK